MSSRLTQDTLEGLDAGALLTILSQDILEGLAGWGTVLTQDTLEGLCDVEDLEPTPGGRGVQRGEAIGARVEAMDVSVGGRQ